MTLADGTLLARRSERVIDTARRQVRTQSRYERRARSQIVAREDETTTMTWYDEKQITTLARRTRAIVMFVSAAGDNQPARPALRRQRAHTRLIDTSRAAQGIESFLPASRAAATTRAAATAGEPAATAAR